MTEVKPKKKIEPTLEGISKEEIETIPEEFRTEADKQSKKKEEVPDISEEIANEIGVDLEKLTKIEGEIVPDKTPSIFDGKPFGLPPLSSSEDELETVRVRTMKNLSAPPTIGRWKWFDHFGNYRTEMVVQVPRFVAHALIEAKVAMAL